MLNDFSTISAEDGISRLAQVTPEETAEANAFFDELQARQDEQAGIVPVNERNWAMFNQIHAELEPKMALLRLQDDNLNY